MSDKFKSSIGLIFIVIIVACLAIFIYSIVTDWASVEQWLRKPISQYITSDIILLGAVLSLFFRTNITNKIDKNNVN